jgi:hypothetical protein
VQCRLIIRILAPQSCGEPAITTIGAALPNAIFYAVGARFILENYKRMTSTYMEEKDLIPSEHLIELRYEELTPHPMELLSVVTERLNLGVKADLSKAQDYLGASSDFPVRKYRFSNEFLKEVNDTLEDLIGRQGYKVRTTN